MAIKKVEIAVPYQYKCRDYQIPFWKAMASGIKRAVLVWHRRAGKEKTCWNYMITQAVTRLGNYYYIFPDAKMGRRIIWDGVDKAGLKTLAHIPKELIHSVNNAEMKLFLRHPENPLERGSEILVLGAHDEDSIRGTNPVGVVFSEYAEHSPRVWPEIVYPILKENGGWAIFNFTPKGQNHAKDLFDMATHNSDWFAERLTIEDTGVISKNEVENEVGQGLITHDMARQEYWCDFNQGIEGSYYAKYLEQAKLDGRITNVPCDPHAQVHTAWDIGYGDSTAIVFFQIVGQEVHIIDYYENHAEGLPHYAKVLQDKKYLYGKHYAPADIESHHFATGLAAKSVGMQLGIHFVTLPTQRTRIEDGIEAVRGLFPRLWIDAVKCRQLTKALENYRKEYDEKHNCYRLRPVHDCWSHAADSMRYMGMAVKLFVDHSKGGLDDAAADRLYNTYNPIFK